MTNDGKRIAAMLFLNRTEARDKTYGGPGVSNSPSLEKNLPFCRAKTVIQCTSAGKFAETRAIVKLLLLRKRSQTKNVHPQIFHEVTFLTEAGNNLIIVSYHHFEKRNLVMLCNEIDDAAGNVARNRKVPVEKRHKRTTKILILIIKMMIYEIL